MSSASNTVSPSASTSNAARSTSRISLRGIAILYIALALCVTGYMSYQKLSDQPLQCAASGIINCSVLEASNWAVWRIGNSIAIPTAVLGFLTHCTLLTLFLLENRIGLLRSYGKMFIFGITIFGFLYHSYLTFYVAIYTFRAICPYCLTAHLCMTVLLIIASIRLFRSFQSASVPDAA